MNLYGPPIDRGWAWVILVGAFINFFMVTGSIRSVGILFVVIVQRFNASRTLTAITLGLMGAGFAVLSPIANALGQRFGNRRVVLLGVTITCIGSFLTAFAPNIYSVIVTFGLITGMGYGLIFSPSFVIVGQYFCNRRSLANGLAAAGGSVGQLVIPQVVVLLLDEYSFQGCMMIYAGILLNGLVGAALYRPITDYLTSANANGEFLLDKTGVNLNLNGDCVTPDVIANGSIDEAVHQTKNTNSLKENGSLPKIFIGEHGSTNNLSSENGSPRRAFQGNLLLERSHSHIAIPPGLRSSASELRKSNLSGGLQHSDYDLRKSYLNGNKHIAAQNLNKSVSELRKSHLHGSTESHASIRGSMRNLGAELEARHHMYASTHSLHFAPLQEPITLPSVENNTQLPSKQLPISICCNIFDWSLFKNWLFIIYVFGLTFGHGGYINLCLFLPPYANECGMTQKETATLISVIGVADLAGRIFGGWFADLGLIRRSRIMAGCLIFTGIWGIFIPLLPVRSVFYSFAVVLGLIGGVYVSLMAVVIIDFMGLEKLASALGLATMCMGLMTIPIPLTLGILRDTLGSFDAPIQVCGALMFIGGLFFALEYCAKHLNSRSRRKPDADT